MILILAQSFLRKGNKAETEEEIQQDLQSFEKEISTE